MSALAVLQEERVLLSDPERHCRGAMARDGEGSAVDAQSPRAASWCLIGASLKLGKATDGLGTAHDLLHHAAQERGFPGIERANDELDHAEVLAILDAAIDAAKALEGEGA